jgi:hypothetical protein
MQLLTVGRSFSKQVGDPSRFRMANPGWLPRFGSTENPGADPVMAGPDRTVTEAAAAGTVEPVVVAQRSTTGQEPRQSTRLTGAPALDVLVDEGRKWNEVNKFPLGRWTVKESAGAQMPPRPKVTVLTRPLALDEVRVVRNDLNDEDLELIPRRNPSVSAHEHRTAVDGGPTKTPARAPAPIGWFRRWLKRCGIRV